MSNHILSLYIFTCHVHVKSESTFCDCVTDKELIAQNRRNI